MEYPQEPHQLIETGIERYAESMFRVAYRWSGCRALAEEAVQETWIGAWRNIEQLRDQNHFKAWLFGILRNQIYRAIAKASRMTPHVELTDQLTTEQMTQSSRSDLQQSVQDALQELDEKYRLPILLVSMENWSTEEAAQFLGIPRGTVLSRLHRGRNRLKEILTRELELEGPNE